MGVMRMTAWEAKHQAQLAEWQERIIRCRTSGRTVKAWCEEQGIGYKTYYRWERQILSLGRKTLQQVGQQQLAQIESPVFAEVRMTEEKSVKGRNRSSYPDWEGRDSDLQRCESRNHSSNMPRVGQC